LHGEFVMPEAITIRSDRFFRPMKRTNLSPVAPPADVSRRILFLVTEDWYFVSHRLGLALELRAAGWEVHVACSINKHRDAITERGVIVHPVSFFRESLSPWSVLRTARQLRRVINEVAPVIVCAVALRPILVGRMALIRSRNMACINLLTGRGSIYSSKHPSLKLRLARFVVDQWLRFASCRRNSHIVVQNGDDLDDLRGRFRLTENDCTLIRGSGIRASAWTPVPEPADPPFRLIYVGRLLRDKGAGELVQASQLLVKRGLSVTVDLVGDIDESNPECYQPSEIDPWEKLKGVTWKGRRSDVLEQISSAHVMVHPSHYGEGLPKVILEAGLCGRAVVTCDTVGCREAVRDGDNGLLVPPRNPAALADAIERLARDGALRQRLAMRHRQRVLAEFGDEAILPQYIELIERIAKGVNQ